MHGLLASTQSAVGRGKKTTPSAQAMKLFDPPGSSAVLC